MRNKINVDGISLSYIDMNPGKKSSIVFIHGNSSSADTWRPQLSDNKFSHFRLIAFDLPAHGLSTEDKSYRYGIIELAEILSEAVKRLQIEAKLILVGISLGSNIAAEMLSFLKPSGIVLAGPTIIGDDLTVNHIFQPDADVSVIFNDENSIEAICKYFKHVVYKAEESLYNDLIKDFENVKAPFRSTLLSKVESGQMSNELEILRTSELQPLIVLGQEDRIINTHYLDNSNLQLWNRKPHLIEHAGHLVHIDQPLEFNQILAEYVKECFKKS